jgi:hypothetical protein
MSAPAAFRMHEKQNRYTDEEFLGPKRHPAKPKPPIHADSALACPYCHQPLPYSHTSIPLVLSTAVRRFAGAVWMLWHVSVRCVRFAVGGVFCLIGAAGSFLLRLGVRIVDPADRRFVGRR